MASTVRNGSGRARPRTRRAWWLSLVALVGACSSSHGSGDGNGGEDSGVTITITAPKPAGNGQPTLVRGVVTVEGSLAFAGGVSGTGHVSAEWLGNEATRTACTVLGDTFRCIMDSALELDGKPVNACNDTAVIRVRASGQIGAGEVEGLADVDLHVDNCAPNVTLLSPEPDAAVIGSLAIEAKVSDPMLVSAHLRVTASDGTDLLPAPLDLPAGSTTWQPRTVLDRSAALQTEQVRVVVTATDAVGQTTEVVREAMIVRQPRFLGSDLDKDRFDPGKSTADHPVDMKPTHFALVQELVPYAQQPELATDALVDVVLATTDGVVVRAGQPLVDAAGEPLGPKLQHAGTFDNPVLDGQLAPFRVVRDTQRVAVSRVLVRDLDGDGDTDIVALGTDGQNHGVVWVILNLLATRQDGSTLRAFKLVAKDSFAVPPMSAAWGDLTADGVPDLLVGAAQPSVGLMTWVFAASPSCTLVDGTSTACGQVDDFARVKSAQVFAGPGQVALHKGVTGIASIAVADFYGDPQDLDDVCVGEAARGIVSCYRNVNHDGTLAQAQDSYVFADAQDSHAIVATKFSTSSGPDLIVQSTSGKFVRWLTGDHNGGFKTVENNTPGRNIGGLGCSTLGQGQVGPLGFAGQPYLTAITHGRLATIIPTQLNDNSHVFQCFRSWVLGGALVQLEAADINGDNAPDLIGLDLAKPGMALALGQLDGDGLFTGNFLAPDAHHVCAANPLLQGFGVHEIAEAVVDDWNGDQKLDVLAIGSIGGSMQGDRCPLPDGPPGPSWMLAAYLQSSDRRLAPQPRAGEFSPWGDAEAGMVACDPLGSVGFARSGDATGDGQPDLVVTQHGAGYTLGNPEGATCNCPWSADNEVDSAFGGVCPTAWSPTCGPPGPSCRNYAQADKCQATPLTGYGGGAPLNRSTAAVFASAPAGPLGLAGSCDFTTPCRVKPVYTLAAGLDPQGLALADFDHDGNLDMATALDTFGTPCLDSPYLAPRVRLFGGNGAGGFAARSPGAPKDTVMVKDCKHGNTLVPLDVGYRTIAPGVSGLSAGIWPNPLTGKFDAGLFALARTNGQIAILAHRSLFAFEQAKLYPLGKDVKAISVSDINRDAQQQVDVLALLGLDLSYLPGAVLADGTTGYLDTKVTLVEGTQAADWMDTADFNHDGFQDFLLLDSATSTMEIWLGVGRDPTPLASQFVRWPVNLRVAVDARDTDLRDMDGDGCVDVVVRSKLAVTVLHNETAGCAGKLLP